MHNRGSSILLTVVAGALLAYAVYSRRTARPRAKQGRRPQKEAADRRRRRQAGAAAEATQGEAQVGTNEARAEAEAAKHKAAKAETAALAAAAGKAAAKAVTKAATKAAAAKAAAEAAKAAAAAEALDRPSSSLPVMSLAAAQFDTGRRAVPESTIGGQTTCIVCFVNPKSHAAVPCGHQCACGDCARQMRECPVCRNPALQWMQVRVA